MKKLKKVFAMLVLSVCCVSLAGCGSNNKETSGNEDVSHDEENEKNGDEMTLSEWLSGDGIHIIYQVNREKMSKDSSPSWLYVFKDGKCTEMGTSLTYGEIVKLTDEEIINQSSAIHISLIDDAGKELEEKAKDLYYSDMDYKVCVFSDDSGNNFACENIVFKYKDINNDNAEIYDAATTLIEDITNISPQNAIIYDGEFIEIHTVEKHYDSVFWIRKEEGIQLTLDTLDSKDVVIDPQSGGLPRWIDDEDIINKIFAD